MNYATRLQGKAVIVLGAGTGIGASTARRVAAEGARVCLADINLDAAEAVAADIRGAGQSAFALAFDIADETSVNAVVSEAASQLGGLDGAHINAADLKIIHEDSDVLSESMAVFDRTIVVNLRGHFLATRALLPVLLQRGGGALVYTSSGAAEAAEPTRPAYAMSKSGINALMRHVASGWGRKGIRANCVSPGLTITDEMRSSGLLPPEFEKMALAATPHQRLGHPDDIAAMVAMLLSEDGQWINGQAYHVDGGTVMR
ncbi:SDR family NAD(P)-dependent oxidoreductase [Parahaliea aestuarii]|uniref:SDR family oxidoreductase n=1 Tax=Parahaliea aestuarii TaxID=1852021 RepID=A0A5C8ZX76_9GAMM|nr:SDR family oxidoreductase [Parahaliea aestuarii]TXS93125.1 SDR family oxidoreductase [Parahaliea aestuarii]